jgi:hypothetical protein
MSTVALLLRKTTSVDQKGQMGWGGMACGQAAVARRDGLRDGRLQRRHLKTEGRKRLTAQRKLLARNGPRFGSQLEWVLGFLARNGFCGSVPSSKCVFVFFVRNRASVRFPARNAFLGNGAPKWGWVPSSKWVSGFGIASGSQAVRSNELRFGSHWVITKPANGSSKWAGLSISSGVP